MAVIKEQAKQTNKQTNTNKTAGFHLPSDLAFNYQEGYYSSSLSVLSSVTGGQQYLNSWAGWEDR